MPSGRRPNWPAPWLVLAVQVGGSVALRRSLGYASKTTLSGKIRHPENWRRADVLLLLSVLKRQSEAPTIRDLVPELTLRTLLGPDELAQAGLGVF